VDGHGTIPANGDPQSGHEPKTPRARQKRRRVMEAAASLIAEKGYHETSMRDIAAALGMSAASLYHYFPGKEDLVVALQRECFDDLFSRARQKLDGVTDPTERIYAFIQNHMVFFVENIALIRVLLHEDMGLSKGNRDEIRHYKQEYMSFAETILREVPRDAGAPPIDPRIVVFSLFGMMNWFYTWQHSAPDLEGQDLAHAITQIFLRGFQSNQAAVPELVW
jgi:AcrR family transcriptional regulator